MYPISSLVQSIFTTYIMKNFSDTHTIASGNNSFFIKFIFVLSQWLLRTDIKWILTIFNGFISVA